MTLHNYIEMLEISINRITYLEHFYADKTGNIVSVCKAHYINCVLE